LSKPFTYSDLLKSIQNLYGSRTLTSIDHIRCLFSRDDALRLPIKNDDDLNKVLTIAEANGSTKLSFLLTRKKSHTVSRMTPVNHDHDDSGSISDDAQIPELDDTSLDSPPPGTIAPLRRRAATNTTNETTTSKDGGIFIPESVRFN
jgi:hypothetical protein